MTESFGQDLPPEERADGANRTDTSEGMHRPAALADTESLCSIVAGVAHDLNNLLTVIVSHVTAIEYRAENAPEFRMHLQGIRRAISRASDLTSELQYAGFNHNGTERTCDLNQIASEAIAILRPVLRSGASIESKLARGPLMIRGSSKKVGRMVTNLLSNAHEALREQGVIQVRTGSVPKFGKEHGGNRSGQCPRYAEIVIRDNGIGMDASTKMRAFEPYFTTKASSGGSGLGLSVVSTIAKQIGADIRVDSKVGHGTKFTIYLPLA